MTEDLYSASDVKRVRELLLKEQGGLDLLTKIEIPCKMAVLDHKHDINQFVRGVLHRQCNVVLGKIENLWSRYLSYWYPYNLQTFLRQVADYLDREEDKRFRHPNFQKKLKTIFNGLSAKQQNYVLSSFINTVGNNATARKQLFSKIVLDKSNGYARIVAVINQAKEKV